MLLFCSHIKRLILAINHKYLVTNDRVWHEGIIFKLKNLGIRGKLLKWYIDYLDDRFQRVTMKGKSLEWGRIPAGVPQGSVLGPLLFLVYINDLPDAVDCPIKMFADDTSLYVTLDDPIETSNILNTNLENVRKWAEQWIVNFNPGKTKSMTITNRHHIHPPYILVMRQLRI